MISPEGLEYIFSDCAVNINVNEEILKDIKDTNIVFTCGSGVTASVLAFALSLINNKYLPIIYDGSWSEYGKYPS